MGMWKTVLRGTRKGEEKGATIHRAATLRRQGTKGKLARTSIKFEGGDHGRTRNEDDQSVKAGKR